MKKILLIMPILMLTLTLFAGSIFAQTGTTEPTLSPIPSTSSLPLKNKGLKNHVAKEEVVTNLQKRANNEIDRRVTSLTELISKIDSLKKLSALQKSTLSSQVQAEIASLNTLKAKIDADTDLVTLKVDVKSVVSDYRVFALYIPQIRMIIAADSMQTTSDNLTTLANKLQTLITTSGASGANLISVNNYLSDMKAKIIDANTNIVAVESEVLLLTPQGYPGNKATLEDARAKIKLVMKDLKTARDDARQIIKILRSLNKPLGASKSAEFEK